MTRRRLAILGVLAAQAVALGVLVVVQLRRIPPDVVRLVREVAGQEGLDPDLAEALLRAESRGVVRALSPAGAVGLLQLMPATAREIARREGIPLEDEPDLYDPETNVRLGLIYLRDMLERFGGDEWLALAAYNAGPGRVQVWLDAHPDLGPEALIREAAFEETRAHVIKVLRERDRLREAREGGSPGSG
jgi:soluble lytic murein transglycosylase